MHNGQWREILGHSEEAAAEARRRRTVEARARVPAAMDVHPLTPVLVGCARYTQRHNKQRRISQALSPLKLCTKVAREAILDASGGHVARAEKLRNELISSVVVVELASVSAGIPIYSDLPLLVAHCLNVKESARTWGTHTGGNTPQMLINVFAERIAKGQDTAVLLAGAEALHTFATALKSGYSLPSDDDNDDGEERLVLAWGDCELPRGNGDKQRAVAAAATQPSPSSSSSSMIGLNRPGVNAQEKRHSMGWPVNTYPLFETALRGHLGRSVEEHSECLGRLFSGFSRVAALPENSKHSWFPTYHSADSIQRISDTNRMVGSPYTKRMNAVMTVDQAAAVVMMSYAEACRHGVDPRNMVFLVGCSDVVDIWNVTERSALHTSPAARILGREAMKMARRMTGAGGLASFNDPRLRAIDIYSCFPCAVEIQCRELGIKAERGDGHADHGPSLTLTGGLPYHGGPGNNYSMHAICAMCEDLRRQKSSGKSDDVPSFGLITANGWFLTKFSCGIYSTTPPPALLSADSSAVPWSRRDPAEYQREIDNLPRVVVAAVPNGVGRVETYTVLHNRAGVWDAIIIGRLVASDERFVANAKTIKAAEFMSSKDCIGSTGMVSCTGEGSKAVFDPIIAETTRRSML